MAASSVACAVRQTVDDEDLAFFHLEETTSTMDAIRDTLASGQYDSRVVAVCAKAQRAGRGTRGRKWDGMQGNVLLTVAIPMSSVRIPITLLPLRVGTLIYPEIVSRLWQTPDSRAAATAAATTTTTTAAERPKVWLKWPNDILIGERKVSGVLIEMEGDRLLIGMGVNLRSAPEVPTQGADRGRPATCMAEHGAHADDASVLDLAHSIARRVARWSLHQFDDTGEKVVEDWSSLSCWDKTLVLRETQERVWPLRLMPDGSLAVRVVGTNEERVLLADYLW